MNKTEKAVEYHQAKFNSSQSVFTVFGTESGLSEDECLKVSCAFGGGMGRCQLVCGAVTGALMALGLKYGKGIGDSEEKKMLTYAKTREFFAKFTELNGSLNCRELLNGLDLNDPVDCAEIRKQDLFNTLCEKKFITDAVSIVEDLLK